jgi:ketosteroid isomerase-like protein
MSNSSTLQLARRFVRALNEKDEVAIREIYSPEVRIWHNFDGKYQTIDENLKGMYWIHKRLSAIDYDVVRLIELPDGYLQEHVLRGKLPSGESFAMPACVICTVQDGRVVSLREYLDLTHTLPLTEKRATN